MDHCNCRREAAGSHRNSGARSSSAQKLGQMLLSVAAQVPTDLQDQDGLQQDRAQKVCTLCWSPTLSLLPVCLFILQIYRIKMAYNRIVLRRFVCFVAVYLAWFLDLGFEKL